MTKTITFENIRQAAIFKGELLGQFSDGHWENSGALYDQAWKEWADVKVMVGPNTGCNFEPIYGNYRVTSRKLMEVVGERMKNIAWRAEQKGFWDDELESVPGLDLKPAYEGEYTDAQLLEDLKGVGRAMRQRV